MNKTVLVIDPPPKNCKECVLHILTFEKTALEKEIYSCAGHKGRGTLNSEIDFLNNFDSYSEGCASNCPLVSVKFLC